MNKVEILILLAGTNFGWSAGMFSNNEYVYGIITGISGMIVLASAVIINKIELGNSQ